ncbi:pyridoxal phosphate-dependent aminotransferase [Marinicella sp. S1101]|uniref:pyridoxal phosphate-dependent aminotransferase n=1 Tax=Marinicella marina TaxID=2996016 RepID=UPI002260F140|nr:pyridoxal phosphate-dependent aminotransferase [Marinicella marina]MCX7554616.1 pyridoxal phosphate-dependent aminotransferase [Marinicella marina]MDJ1140681.1 pyridoxal phosphate-dependent aminotransferase [Marinicella marina]
MSDFVANLVKRVKPSATIAVSMKAAELKRAGKDVIGLGAGEPDFDTPDHIKAAAIEAINNGQTKYTAVDGTPELKQAISDKLLRENHVAYQANEIIVSCGAKHSISNLLSAVINPGDEVIIPTPYWVSYPDMTLLAGGESVIVETNSDNDFKLTPSQLAKAITSKTRLVMLNSPSNPTGKAYTPDELQALGEVIAENPHVLVATDDIYEHIYWGHEPLANMVALIPELRDRTIIINGVSKAYAMTGWRIGYAAGPEAIITAMRKIQSQSTSNPCSISQAAAAAALNGPQDCLVTMQKAFKQRHDYLVKALNELPGMTCGAGNGAFYAFPDVTAVVAQLDGVNDDVALATWLLEEAGVAVVPGTPFGAPGFVRLSFATSIDVLQSAVARMDAALRPHFE